MTGTPLDLLNLGGLLQGIGLLYWVVATVLLFLAVRRPRTRQRKVVWSVIVVATFGWTPAKVLWQTYVSRSNLSAATKHFEQRCKGAGEKITRTVENVEGVVWMKWRDKIDVKDDFDQFKLSDPYGRDCHAEECIEQLLRTTKGLDLDPSKKEPFHIGYRFAESADPSTDQLNRYTRQLYRPHDRDAKYTEKLVRAELVAQPITQRTARYGITWEDISTRKDREHWVAGGSLKVIDLQTNEVIAERVGYMMDRGQGNREGFRTPWLMARRTACPQFPGSQGQRSWPNSETSIFAFRVLQPTKGE